MPCRYRSQLPFATFFLSVIAFAGAAGAQATRPALAQLDEEVRALHKEVEAGTVRVQVPVDALGDLLTRDEVLRKWWPQLDEDVRERLRPSSPSKQGLRQPEGSAWRAGPSTRQAITDPGDPSMVVMWPPDARVSEQLGVVLDDQGHFLIFTCLDKSAAADAPFRVSAGQKMVEATFVGSDRQTNVTVLKASEPVGKPLNLSDGPLPLGACVLMLAPTKRVAKLAVWMGGRDEQGLVVTAGGRLGGFVRGGQMLTPAALKPVADQLIKTGEVRRARLGVWVGDVEMDDPLRARVPLLATQPAVRVEHVLPGSAAERGGLRASDVILAVADAAVTDLPTFAAAIASRRGPTPLKVLRGPEEITVTVDLQPEP